MLKMDEIKLKLVSNGYGIVEQTDFGMILFSDNKRMNTYIEQKESSDESKRKLNSMYERSSELYLLSKNEDELFLQTKRKYFQWALSRFGTMQNAKGKVSVHFGYFERGNIFWESVEF